MSAACEACATHDPRDRRDHGHIEPMLERIAERERSREPEPRGGMCTACGSVEVILNHPTGVRDLSDIGESSEYLTGYGCEVCS